MKYRSQILTVIILGICLCAPMFLRRQLPGHEWYLLQEIPLFSLFPIPVLVLYYISIALSIVNLFLLYTLLKQYVDVQERVMIVLLWGLSSSFLFVTHTSIIQVIMVTLTLMILHLLKKKNLFSAVMGIIAGLLAPSMAIGTAVVTIIYGHYNAKRLGMITATLAVVSALATYLLTDYFYPSALLQTGSIVQEIGGIGSMGIIVFTLGIIGGIQLWQRNRKMLYIGATVLIIAALFISGWNIFVSGVLSISAGYFVVQLIRKKWSTALFKHYFLVAIAIGIIVATLQTSILLSQLQPQMQLQDAITILDSQEGNVLTHQQYGSFVNQPYMHMLSSKEILQQGHHIFTQVRLENATELLEQSQIDFILITKDMKQGLVWQRPDQGLLLLLQNTESFTKIHEDEFTEVYKYNKQN